MIHLEIEKGNTIVFTSRAGRLAETIDAEIVASANEPVADLVPLRRLTRLRELRLVHTNPRLEALDLRGTGVSADAVAALERALPRATVSR